MFCDDIRRSMMRPTSLFVIASSVIASPCLARGNKDITARVVTAEQRKSCKYLGLVTYRQAIGWNKAGGALKHALRKVQEMGGDSLFIVTEHQDPFAGASVNGEALKCAGADTPPAEAAPTPRS